MTQFAHASRVLISPFRRMRVHALECFNIPLHYRACVLVSITVSSCTSDERSS